LIKVVWTGNAVNDLKKLDRLVARRIIKKISWFSAYYDKVIHEPLSGDLKGMFKLRVGNWRVIYTLKSDTAIIYFVGHRSDIYEDRA